MFQIGAGSKPRPEAAKPKAPRKPAMVSVTVKLQAGQKQKYELLGGDAWLREQIDAAKAEPFSAD
ncbi:MAG: hypothetical protein ACJ8GO_02015 [Ramlibacter sp.]